jgi:hypothetical protein
MYWVIEILDHSSTLGMGMWECMINQLQDSHISWNCIISSISVLLIVPSFPSYPHVHYHLGTTVWKCRTISYRCPLKYVNSSSLQSFNMIPNCWSILCCVIYCWAVSLSLDVCSYFTTLLSHFLFISEVHWELFENAKCQIISRKNIYSRTVVN